ncbi:MAG: CDP-alcohol phosphatidyltransferase family protein [Thermoprotei archaeon]|nr:MAG: CDP-alcohol phosphatidyltransferase family protein [Thermoprotei archaeon]
MRLYLPKSTDGPVSRYINRRISGPMTYLIVRLGIPLTPNQVSVISFLLGVVAAWLYLSGMPIAAGVMVQIASIVDGVDGELARLKKMTSKRGAFLDAVLDRLVDILVIMSLTLYLLVYDRAADPILATLIGSLALTGSLMVSYVHARGEASVGIHPSKIGRIPNFSSRDVRLFALFLGSVLGFYVETLVFIALASYAYVLIKTVEVFLHTKS